MSYLASIRQIRDNEVSLFEKIKRLPRKAKTGRYSKRISDETTLSFIRKGHLKTFFITRKEQTNQISFIDAISYLKCEPSEEKIGVGTIYFSHYNANNDAFDYSLVEEEVIVTTKSATAGNDQKMIRYLRALMSIKELTDEQEDKIRRMIEIWENGDVPANDTKNILKSIKSIENGVEAYYQIISQVDEKYFDGRKQNLLKVEGEKQVILSCYMKEVSE